MSKQNTTDENITLSPYWTRAIKSRRIQLGFTQSQLVKTANQAFNQEWISSVERGETSLEQAAFARVIALARVLKWSLSEMQEALQIDLGITPKIEPDHHLRKDPPTYPIYPLEAVLNTSIAKPLDFQIPLHHKYRRTTVELLYQTDTVFAVDTHPHELSLVDKQTYICLEGESVFVAHYHFVNGFGIFRVIPSERLVLSTRVKIIARVLFSVSLRLYQELDS